MTVQIPDAGLGDGKTGDNEYVYRKKVQDNFEDQTNAASKLVGTASGQIPLAQDVYALAYIKEPMLLYLGNPNNYTDVGQFPLGSYIYINGTTPLLGSPTGFSPTQNYYFIKTTLSLFGRKRQFGYGHSGSNACITRLETGDNTWTEWVTVGQTVKTYNTTTAAGANVVVDATGKLMRSTSSERYKEVLAPLVLDDAAYASAMALAPIAYRSTADADNPAYHYYSFSAEKLGAFDPAFTLWRETEIVTDADGNTTEQPLAERVAEGININALLAFSHAIAIKQDKMIAAQAAAIDVLTKRIDAMTAQ